MEVAGDTKTWLTEASEVVPLLLQKSLQVTSAFIELSKCVQRAHQASNEFMAEYFSSNKIKGNKSLRYDDEEVLFVSVITSLANDGTFWCKYWTSQSRFDSNDMQQLSDELGWMEKEMTVKRADPPPLNKPLFTFSNSHNMYVRLMALRFDPPEQTAVRYLDLGTVGEISPTCVLYHVPHNIEKMYPYKTMFCTLHEDEFTNLPYEAKWKFRDLTCHQVLMVKVVKRIFRHGISCSVVEMKPLSDNEGSQVNQEVFKKVKEQELTDEARQPNSRNTSHQNNADSALFKKPYPKSRSSSLTCLVDPMVKSSMHVYHSTESLVPHKKFSKGSDEKIKDRKAKEELAHKNHESKGRGRSRKSSSSEGKVFQNSGKEINDEQKEGEYWVDLIPHSIRSQVRPVIPPLLNIFYSATKLRSEHWREIELMNIERLLKSQANIRFYSYDVSLSRLESSFEDGNLIIPRDKKNVIVEARKSCSVYLILRSYVYPNKRHSKARQILGIARLKSGIPTSDRSCPVSYYTLSILDKPKNEWIQKLYDNLTLISLKDAKAVVQHYASSLHSGKNEPVFPNIYPWCGIPPLMNIVKSDASQKVSDVVTDPIPVSLESWDTEVDEQHQAEADKIQQNNVEEKELVVVKETNQTMKILQRSESLSVPVNEENESKNEVNVTNLPEGHYDKSGVWYPNIETAMIIAKLQEQLNVEHADIDMNQNILCSTRSSESEDKSDEKESLLTPTGTESTPSDGKIEKETSTPSDVKIEKEMPQPDKSEDFENDSGLAIDFERSVDQLLQSASNSMANVNVDDEVPISRNMESPLFSGSLA